MAICSKYRRLLSSILSIILCITIIGGVTLQAVYCAPVVIPLASLAPIVAKILITAGVSFISYEALNGASRECINGMSEALAEELRSMVGSMRNNAITVSENVWEYCKTWVDTTFNTGVNSYAFYEPIPYVSGQACPKDSQVMYMKNNIITEFYWKTFEGYGIAYFNGTAIAGTPASNVIDESLWPRMSSMKVYNDATYGLYFEFLVDGTSWTRKYPYSTESGKYLYDAEILNMGDRTIEDVNGVDNVIDNPDYIHGNDITGENSFVVSQPYADLLTKTPEAITDADVQAEIESYVGLTCDDVKAETIPDTSDVPDTNTGILQGILDSLTGTITGKITAINDAITNTIARTLDQIKENTQEEEIESNNIFQFFISLLMILKQMVLIVIRFLMFIVVIRSIPAQSFLFDPNTKAVIDYIHNHSLPMFNVSFMQIINAFIGILVAVSVIRILNKNVRNSP